MRTLRYIRVELGRCQHCSRDASDHGIDGICSPLGRLNLPHEPTKPERCYRGYESYAFLDLDSPEATTWLGSGRRVDVGAG